MLGIAERFEVFVVAPDATNVLRRTRVFTGGATWIGDVGFGSNDFLQHDFVFPAIAEILVVLHLQFGTLHCNQLSNRDS